MLTPRLKIARMTVYASSGGEAMNEEFRQQKLEAALRSALSGTALLFVGAGVSFLSKNKENNEIPNGEGLSDILHDAVQIERRKHSLPSIADYYRSQKGAQSLIDMLKCALEPTGTDERLQAWYRLPWRRIYTTNYDMVIESSTGVKNHPRFSHIDKPKVVANGAVIHLNGHLENAVPESVDEDITLTDRSYSLSNLSSSGWMNLFLADMRISKHIIFVGYSLSDLDIARALISDDNLFRKTVIFVGPETDNVELNRIEKFGTVFSEGVDFLFKTFQEVRDKHEPLPLEERLLICQELQQSSDNDAKPAAELAFNQLVFGEAPLQAILDRRKVSGDLELLIERTEVSLAFAAGSGSERFRDFFLIGEFASGKTFAMIQIARSALERGSRVFWLNDGPELARDLSLIARMDGDVWVLCDSYSGKIDVLKAYIKQRLPGQKLVLSERIVTHELIHGSLESEAGFGPTREIALTRMNVAEAGGFDQLVNFAGLWGDYAGLSEATRSKVLMGDLEGSLYRLLIEIIKSKKVQQEISALLDPLQSDENAMRFFITALIVNVLSFDFWINDWQHFYSVPDIRRILEKYRNGIGHFVNLDSSQVYIRSGIFSQYILRNFASDEMILDCLVDMYDCSSRDLFHDDHFSDIAFELRHYNRVEPLFSERNKLYYLRRYFQEIRAFPRTVNNSDYWLQFGIAMSIHGDLNTAREAFKTAYAKESAKDRPNLAKIDNYFARFELEMAIYEDSPGAAFALAQSGANKLMKQTFVESNKHYPFKTGRSFSGIAAKHYDGWDERQRSGFRLICDNLKKRALQWRSNSRVRNKDVDFLIADMDQLEIMFSAS
jgi:hypothetical protein